MNNGDSLTFTIFPKTKKHFLLVYKIQPVETLRGAVRNGNTNVCVGIWVFFVCLVGWFGLAF